MPAATEWIHTVNIGYDLDGAGYSFGLPTEDHPLYALPILIWEDPDLDYIVGSDAVPADHRHGSCSFLAFAPNSGHFSPVVFPDKYPSEWEDHNHVKVAEGSLQGSDHDCSCRGRMIKGEWEFTGSYQDEPLSTCDRCQGDGYVDAPGGEWAFYVLLEREYTPLEQLAMVEVFDE